MINCFRSLVVFDVYCYAVPMVALTEIYCYAVPTVALADCYAVPMVALAEFFTVLQLFFGLPTGIVPFFGGGGFLIVVVGVMFLYF